MAHSSPHQPAHGLPHRPWRSSPHRPVREGCELTILTVVMGKHYDYIDRQIRLIEALNPGEPFEYLIVDNAAVGGRPRFSIDDPHCRVIAGVSAEGLPAEGRGSYHHAAALNMALAHVRTPRLLIMDPDLFVVRNYWIDDCLVHLSRRGLTLLGVPWHYAWHRKWRYFPCVHFLLIDLEKLPIARIDFTPAVAKDRRWIASPFARWLNRAMPLSYARLLLESRRDTGWRLHRKFHRRENDFEAMQPVIDLDADLVRPRYLKSLRARWLEPRLPRRWSFFPAEGTYVPPSAAQEFDHPAVQALQPECFVWMGAPFAFHMRRNMRDKRKGWTEEDASRDQVFLNALLEEIGASGF